MGGEGESREGGGGGFGSRDSGRRGGIGLVQEMAHTCKKSIIVSHFFGHNFLRVIKFFPLMTILIAPRAGKFKTHFWKKNLR